MHTQRPVQRTRRRHMGVPWSVARAAAPASSSGHAAAAALGAAARTTWSSQGCPDATQVRRLNIVTPGANSDGKRRSRASVWIQDKTNSSQQ